MDSSSDALLAPAMTANSPPNMKFVPILPETGLRPWQGINMHVNLMHMRVPVGPKKTRSMQTLQSRSGSGAEVPNPLQTSTLDGWTKHVHPNGRVYLYHERQCVVMEGGTDLLFNFYGVTPVADMWGLAAEVLWKKVGTHPRVDPAAGDHELFLHIDPSSTPPVVSYYFADWTNRSVFWVDETTTPQPIASQDHLDVLHQLHFWTFVDYHPMHHPLPLHAREELDAVLAFHTIDSKTFTHATAPWSPEDTLMLAKTLTGQPSHSLTSGPSRSSSFGSSLGDSQMLPPAASAIPDFPEPVIHRDPSYRSSSTSSSLVNSPELAENAVPGFPSPNFPRSVSRSNSVATLVQEPSQVVSVHEGCSNAAVARLWRQICASRVQNFYGDKWARLARTDRRKTTDTEPAVWIRWLLSLILFNRPPRFYFELQDVYVDEIVYRVHWRAFVEEEIQPEWKDMNTMSTVMLAANMAFLALDAIQDAKAGILLASKVLSLSSSILSIATLFTSMSLNAFHDKLKSASAADAMKYMQRCSTGLLGLFNVAMLYSVPFAMFMWSLLTFVAAVLGFSLQHLAAVAGVPLIITTIVPVVGVLLWMWWSFAGSSPKGRKDEGAPAAEIDEEKAPPSRRPRHAWLRRKYTSMKGS